MSCEKDQQHFTSPVGQHKTYIHLQQLSQWSRVATVQRSNLHPVPAGCAGLQPTVAAIKANKDICLANKETLIAGGPYVLPLAKEYGVNILPADSEHSVSVCLFVFYHYCVPF